MAKGFVEQVAPVVDNAWRKALLWYRELQVLKLLVAVPLFPLVHLFSLNLFLLLFCRVLKLVRNKNSVLQGRSLGDLGLWVKGKRVRTYCRFRLAEGL